MRRLYGHQHQFGRTWGVVSSMTTIDLDSCSSDCRGDGNLHYADRCAQLSHFDASTDSFAGDNGSSFHFVTFANQVFLPSLRRVRRQARAMRIFSTISAFSEKDLSAGFTRHFVPLFTPNSKGFGYWSWKPEVISRALRDINDGDFLLYADAGCHLNKRGAQRLRTYGAWLAKAPNDLLSFQYRPLSAPPRGFPEDVMSIITDREYAKMEVRHYFERRFGSSPEVDTPAVAAGIILIRKSPESTALIELWRQLLWENPDLLTDSFNATIQDSEFIEPRHDQSLFSFLLKHFGGETVSAYETWIPKKKGKRTNWRPLGHYPMLAKRDLRPSFMSPLWRRRARARLGDVIDSLRRK